MLPGTAVHGHPVPADPHQRRPRHGRTSRQGHSPTQSPTHAVTRQLTHPPTLTTPPAQQDRGPHVDDAGEPMTPAELQLRHCLSSRVRRWCGYEYHYSAIDRPWFLRNELQEFLHHLGIAHVTALTRTEWSIIRSAFGKPRRFSAAYLADERAKLEAYRDQVRGLGPYDWLAGWLTVCL